MEPKSVLPPKGVSPKLKAFVIALAVITFIAFLVFSVLLVNRVFTSLQRGDWHDQLIVLGKKLESEGLEKQAIEQYEKFLDSEKVDLSTRAEVARSIGDFYMKQGNCEQALVWFFQVKMADREAVLEEDVTPKIDSCLQQVGNR